MRRTKPRPMRQSQRAEHGTRPHNELAFATAGAVAVWQGSSSLSWLDSDPQGTSEVAENFVTGAVTPEPPWP